MSDDSRPISGAIGSGLGPKPQRDDVKVVVERGDPVRGDSEPNRLVKRAGLALTPDGYELVGSFCVHVYKHPMSLGLAFASQSLEAPLEGERKLQMRLRPYEANAALQDLSIATAKTFGWTPDKKTRKTIIEK